MPPTGAATRVAVLATVAVVGVLVAWLLSSSDEPGWSSDGITLNTSSWEPGDDADAALIASVVRLDPNGCVYLRRHGVDVGVDIIWPAGHTASRQPDGTVNIVDPGGEVVAATGQRLRAGGGSAPSDTELACRAQNTTGPPFKIQTDLPPLNE